MGCVVLFLEQTFEIMISCPWAPFVFHGRLVISLCLVASMSLGLMTVFEWWGMVSWVVISIFGQYWNDKIAEKFPTLIVFYLSAWNRLRVRFLFRLGTMKCFENACFGPSLSSDFLCCLSKHVFTVNMMNVGLQNFWVLDKLHSSLCFAVSSCNSPPNGFVIQLAMWSCDGKRKLNHWCCFRV